MYNALPRNISLIGPGQARSLEVLIYGRLSRKFIASNE